jgi:hypothetical protein
MSSLTTDASQAGNRAYRNALLPTLTGEGSSQTEQGANGLTARTVPAVAERNTEAAVFGRPETLPAQTLPASASLLAQAAINAPQQAAEEEKPDRTRSKWRLSGAFAASAYNPNIDFGSGSTGISRSASGPSLSNNGPSTADFYQSTYQSGATEYRDNLQAGPAQRIVLAAAYPVTNRLTLVTGIETAQQRASSKTSVAFNDNSSAFAARSASPQSYIGQRKTEFSYRTVGVPVAVRYGSAKTGWSVYAKVGAAVNLLLKSRTEIADNASSTRAYTLASSDSPYRKVLASVRGGGGVRYQPTDAAWSLALGPVAEAGLNTLNQNPGGSFFKRSRPYSVGLEASVEFGGQKAAAVAR